ncbi:two-component regulator propeller domain-containing protein [Chryseobacterium sp. MMS23-Vi53]|uniref:hybrid sensor histidine kinase/response regulator n=1 Tax=Chryseobacterium sp. MMS23-Vi53 TaxID=3386644 RepID=UPI0039E945BA
MNNHLSIVFKIFKKQYAICMLFLLSFSFLWPQETVLNFNQIHNDDEFSPSMISSMIQSSQGFIWIGTENGLFRYDGYNFNRYARDKQTTGNLSNNHINVIFEDTAKNLWIGTNHGVNFFDKNANNFQSIDISKDKGGRNYISSFVEDNQKNLWTGTFGGLKKLNKTTRKLESISSEMDKIRVLSLFFDKKYGLFIGCSTGLKCFDPQNLRQKALPKIMSENSEFLKSKIKKILRTQNGDLWFGTETSGAFLYSAKDNSLTQYKFNANDLTSISSNWISDIVQWDENYIWFATKDGLSIFDNHRKIFTRVKHNPQNNFGLSDNDLKCFLKDQTQSVWIGTAIGGINFYNRANLNFTKISESSNGSFGLNNSSASAILKENDHAMWVGTNGGGLNYLDITNKISQYYSIGSNDDKNLRNIITSLVEKDRSTLLCGTFKGLYQFNKNSKQFSQIPLNTENSQDDERPITSLLVDGSDIWIGTNGNGLKKITSDGKILTYKHSNSGNSLSDNFVMALENRENGIWITTQNGLNYFDKKLNKITKIFNAKNSKPLDNNSLTVMFTDSKKRLWIGADYDGLYYLNESNDKFFFLNKSKGLTDATIKSITEDSQGNLWVSAEDFLYKIKIKNNGRFLKDSDFQITRYSSDNGISVKQFLYNAGMKLNDRLLVFGSSKGILLCNPEKIIKTNNANKTVLTKLIVNNETIEADDKNDILKKTISEVEEIKINYDQGYIALEFSNLNFINPQKSRYAYKLSKSQDEDEWHLIGTQNRINLSNLDSGTYTLSIKSNNGDGNWNTYIKEVKIVVLPPWWRTWWAYLSYLILFAGANYAVYRFIQERIKQRREKFLEQMENEQKQEILTTQINFFTNISHEIRTPLTLIKGPVEELLSLENDEKTTYKLKTIKQNSDRLLKLVNELLDFRKAEKGYMKIYCQKQDVVSFCFEIFESYKDLAEEKNIEYKFVLNSNTIFAYFDKNQMEKVVFNLLSNAFKFTKKNGKIVFAVEKGSPSENAVFIKIKDNGIGIPANSKHSVFDRFFQVDDRGVHNMGSGVGLALSKNIVELHHGEISTPDEEGSWAKTVFQIKLQLGKKHLREEQIVENSASENPKQMLIDTENSAPEESKLFEYEDEDTSDPDKKTIMLVEDNEEMRNFIISILSEEYNMIEFAEAKEAIIFLEKEIPDLVISDVMMPEMDGIEFCKYIKTTEGTNHIPVILLTAKASTDNKIDGLSNGADAYITKPFNIKELKLNIANILSSKEILRLKYSGNFILNSDSNKLKTPEELFIKKLMRIIEENLENPDFDVNMLVDKIGMSRTILYKKVNTLTNHSVANLIKNLRLKKAAHIILTTTHPISEVAFMVGFNDRKHFSKEFKKVYKVSPTAYKNETESGEIN